MKVLPARSRTPGKKTAIVGIGHPLRGDDAIGPSIIDWLISSHASANFTLIDAGAVPENCTGTLRQLAPSLVLFIDAAQMDLPPGSIELFHYTQLGSVPVATHSIPFAMLCQYLVDEIGCDIWVLGIQPAQNDLLTGTSPEVNRAAGEIIHFLIET